MDASRLVRKAEQIASAFAVQGEDAAIAQTAQHIRDFWDPRMKSAILALDRGGMSPLVAAALDRI